MIRAMKNLCQGKWEVQNPQYNVIGKELDFDIWETISGLVKLAVCFKAYIIKTTENFYTTLVTSAWGKLLINVLRVLESCANFSSTEM